MFVLCIEVLLYWVHKYFNYVFLLDWSLDHYVVSFLISCNILILRSVLSDMRIATPVFFCFPFACNIFFQPLTFSLCVSLGLKWVYQDLQDLLELIPKKDVLFIIGDWNAKVGSQESPGVIDKFSLGVQNEAGQNLIEFCQENPLVITNTIFWQHKRRHGHHQMVTPKSD